MRHNLTWSNSRQAWQERLSGVALLAVSVFVYAVVDWFPLVWQVLVWCGIALAWAILLRRGWMKLFGPVLFYDLVRTARRSRYVLLRLVYALILFCSLFAVWLSYYESAPSNNIPANEMTKLAGTFFFVLLSVQFLAVGLLTPAYTAGAVAEEKERKTLEFLLATDLRNREIVLSKQLSRFANLTLLVCTGLPILSLTQLFGGIDPELVLAGFAATALTMASLTSVAIVLSVYAKRSRDAIVLTYLTGVAYLGVSAFTMFALLMPTVPGYNLLAWVGGSFSVSDLVEVLNSGNLVVAWFKMIFAFERGTSLGAVVPDLLRNYAIFHGLVTVTCTTWAVLRLRIVALTQTYGKAQKRTQARRWWVWARPRVGLRPMIWKEVHAERGLSLNLFGRLIMLLLIIVTFIPPAWILVEMILETLDGDHSWERWFAEAMNAWVRVAGAVVACLGLLGVAVRASGSISGERDRQTLESLLTSPLGSTEILFAKWWGSLVSVRWVWLWLGLIWGIGTVVGGMDVLALPLLPVAWFIYAAFLAVLGLWFSLTCRTTMRANVWTLIAIAALSFGHWLPWFFCCLPLRAGVGPDSVMQHIAYFQLYGFTPPVTLGWLAFHAEEFQVRNQWNDPVEYLMDAIVGLFCWIVGAWVLWIITSRRFRVVAGRLPYIRRRPAPPLSKPRPPVVAVEEVIPVDGE
jgi:ABC-type transport system involved in multi-copper enzyme maturation permease subunit